MKRLEAALKSFGPGFHVYQYLFKRNRPAISFAHYENAVVEAAIDQRQELFERKHNSLYQIDLHYVVLFRTMVVLVVRAQSYDSDLFDATSSALRSPLPVSAQL